ncbi:MAG: hypothetical protein V4671_11620 [Armatimonadota bacterium]
MTGDEIRLQREKCTDCGGHLEEIKVFQEGEGSGLLPLPYASNEAKLTRNNYYPATGILLAFACTSCARVAFYAAANDKK